MTTHAQGEFSVSLLGFGVSGWPQCKPNGDKFMKPRVVRIQKSLVAKVGRDCIILINGRLLEGCKVLVEDSSFLIVQLLWARASIN